MILLLIICILVGYIITLRSYVKDTDTLKEENNKLRNKYNEVLEENLMFHDKLYGGNMKDNMVFTSNENIELFRIETDIDNNAKLVFNKEKFPQYKVDDFAREFIDILENCEFVGRR